MKKILLPLLVGVLMSAGLVAATGSASVAADPYPGSIATKCKIKIQSKNPLPKGNQAKIKTQVDTPGSNLHPKGTVKFKVKRVNGGYNFKKSDTSYNGRKQTYKTTKLKMTGKYKVRLKFIPKTGSTFVKCSATAYFKVK